ncbi:hypothetical protein Tco_0744204 [Tanacetum coccineum]
MLRSPLLKEHVIKDSMKEGTDSTVQDDSSRSGNDTDTDDVDIRPIYDEEPMAEEVNSRAKIQSHKTRNSNKLVDQKSHTQKPGRQIFTGHRWDSTRKVIQPSTTRFDSEPPHGSNVDIPNIFVCKQTFDSEPLGVQGRKIQWLKRISMLFNKTKEHMRQEKLDRKRLLEYGTNRPEDAYDRVLWSDLRTLFDPPLIEDAIWSLPLQQKMFHMLNGIRTGSPANAFGKNIQIRLWLTNYQNLYGNPMLHSIALKALATPEL